MNQIRHRTAVRTATLATALALLCLSLSAAAAHASQPSAGGQARASQIGPLVQEREYSDAHGHRFVAGSTQAVDLQPYVDVILSTVHGEELNGLRLLVLSPQEVAAGCGSDAEGCWGADPSRGRYGGEMMISTSDGDLVHTLVHEYGHHMDNALRNLSHLGHPCEVFEDGSRRWFAARDARDNLFRNAGCGARFGYERDLGELFAEDYTKLNGVQGWRGLVNFRPPSAGMLLRMREDVERLQEPETGPAEKQQRVGRLRGRGARKTFTFRLSAWTILSANLSGPRGTDFDLHLLRRGGGRPLAVSRGRRSSERVRDALPPGRYVLRVQSYRGGGRFALRLLLGG